MRLANLLSSPLGSRIQAAGNRWTWCFLAASVLFFSWVAWRGWSLPLTDSYASRQAQTAITAQMLASGDNDSLTPFNGLGPPWSVPLEFPAYQMLTAGCANMLDLDITSAGRLMSILGALLALGALLRLLSAATLPPLARLITVALLLFSPLFAHYARTVMIETWALALSLWWLVAVIEALQADHKRGLYGWSAAAILLGIIAAPTKITTFALFFGAAGLVTLFHIVRRRFDALRILLACAVPALFAAVIWTRASDAANASHPFADFLTSALLSEWVWGTPAQRLDPIWWARWAHHLAMVSPGWTYLFIPLGLVFSRGRLRVALLVSTLVACAGPLVFANLYFVHEYYSMATAPACVMAVAMGGFAVWQRSIAHPSWRTLVLAALVLAAGHNVWNYQAGLGRRQMRPTPPPALADVLRELTTPADTILVYGSEWDPVLTYYTDRPMTMVRASHETSETSFQNSRTELAPRDYTVMVATGNMPGDQAFLQERCQQLGLDPQPAAFTTEADIYLRPDAVERLTPVLERLRNAEVLELARPVRAPAAQTRQMWIAPPWRRLVADEANRFFNDVTPLPTRVFLNSRLSKISVAGKEFLHLHPESGLRFKATARPRTFKLRFGMSPELWEKQLASDGVGLRIWFREHDYSTHLAWERWLNPVQRPADRGIHEITLTVPARRTIQLDIDCGPGRDPGFDWFYIESISITP